MLDDHAVIVAGGRIERVVPASRIPRGVKRRDLGGLLAPGFIDAQVNGGGGVLFNDDPSVAAIRKIGAAHRRFGTTGFLPTLITDHPETMELALDAVRQGLAESVPGLLGVHIEGPFLAAERRGVHALDRLRQPSLADLALLTQARAGTVLVTVAPERMPPGSIERLVAAGVRVASGHTAASYEETMAGLARGITGFTHLFNAMSPMTSREPGAVGAALADAESWCGIILDGFHVHLACLRVALAAKPLGKVFLVTDAMPPVGTDAKSFRLYGETITVMGGRCLTDSGVLAGSALDMAAALRNAVALLGLGLDEVLRMASAYPADFLGIADRMGRLKPGMRADLVLLDDGLAVKETWIAGRAPVDSKTVAD